MQGIPEAAAAANGTQFVTVLEKAVEEGLLDLTTGGPYTILVPSNDAFSRLSSQELNNILNDNNQLRDVLEYHVIKGEYFSWDLTNGRVFNTLNGHPIRIYSPSNHIYFNNALGEKLDIEATNGVLHVINQVLDVPEGTIYEVLRNAEYPLSKFADIVDRVRLNRTLDAVGTAKYTVFAPSDDAFANLSPVILDRIHTSITYERELVLYHIHQGTLHLRSLDRNGTVTTLDNRHTISVTVDTDVHLNKVAGLDQADIDCDNGVVHIIDHVLIPSSLGSIIG
nr:hypothetical protein BaRGS_016836 [Batillaria attramentaria]